MNYGIALGPKGKETFDDMDDMNARVEAIREETARANAHKPLSAPAPQADIAGGPEGLNKQNIQQISIGSLLGGIGGALGGVAGGAAGGAAAAAPTVGASPGLIDNITSAFKGGDISKMGIGGNILSRLGVGGKGEFDMTNPDTIGRDDFDAKVQRMQEDMINKRDEPQVAAPGAQASVGQAPAGLNKQNIQSICCFIFMESYHGQIPWFVRRSRDLHMTPERRAGYIWMSQWLVPAMARFGIVRDAVYDVMVKPLTEDAAWVFSRDGAVRREWARRGWLGLWGALGRIVGVPVSHEDCTGKQWRLGRWQVEAWNVPAGVVVKEHIHRTFSSVIIPISGSGAISKGAKTAAAKWLRPYKIGANVPHAVKAGPQGFSFINIQHWTTRPSSASVDFKHI